jgi:hypothetical protein
MGFRQLVEDYSMSDLGNDVLIAIGSVSAEWASLEYYMSRVTHSCWRKYGGPPPKLIGSMSFVDRRKAFVEVVKMENVAPDTKHRTLDLAARIEAAENKRHLIIHGMASEFSDNRDEEMPVATGDKIISFLRDHPKHYFAERLTVAQITDIAGEIQGINTDMQELYVSLWFSRGP